ncbi:MAG: hypothetical protein RLY23_1192, partial [Actinomycetota bacterium]
FAFFVVAADEFAYPAWGDPVFAGYVSLGAALDNDSSDEETIF